MGHHDVGWEVFVGVLIRDARGRICSPEKVLGGFNAASSPLSQQMYFTGELGAGVGVYKTVETEDRERRAGSGGLEGPV